MVNIHRNEETHSHQRLTNPDISNSIDLDKDSCCFRNQDSILAHPLKLEQTSNFENPIDILANYPFPEIALEDEYDPETQLGNSIPLSDSIMTPVSSPDCNPFSESIFDPVPVHREIKSPIFYDQHIELDQYHTF